MVTTENVELVGLRDCWRTPRHVWSPLVDEYRLTHDAAADDCNAVCLSYWTAEDDALAQDWAGKRIWANPPYSGKGRAGRLVDWVEKAYTAEVCVMLLPSRTDQRWFRMLYLLAQTICFVEGRIQFEPPPGVQASQNREGSIVAVFSGGPRSGGHPLMMLRRFGGMANTGDEVHQQWRERLWLSPHCLEDKQIAKPAQGALF